MVKVFTCPSVTRCSCIPATGPFHRCLENQRVSEAEDVALLLSLLSLRSSHKGEITELSIERAFLHLFTALRRERGECGALRGCRRRRSRRHAPPCGDAHADQYASEWCRKGSPAALHLCLQRLQVFLMMKNNYLLKMFVVFVVVHDLH